MRLNGSCTNWLTIDQVVKINCARLLLMGFVERHEMFMNWDLM